MVNKSLILSISIYWSYHSLSKSCSKLSPFILLTGEIFDIISWDPSVSKSKRLREVQSLLALFSSDAETRWGSGTPSSDLRNRGLFTRHRNHSAASKLKLRSRSLRYRNLKRRCRSWSAVPLTANFEESGAQRLKLKQPGILIGEKFLKHYQKPRCRDWEPKLKKLSTEIMRDTWLCNQFERASLNPLFREREKRRKRRGEKRHVARRGASSRSRVHTKKVAWNDPVTK